MAAHPPIIGENPAQLVERTKFPPPPLKNTTITEGSVHAERRDFRVNHNRRTNG